jgi:hypothetical protein
MPDYSPAESAGRFFDKNLSKNLVTDTCARRSGSTFFLIRIPEFFAFFY